MARRLLPWSPRCRIARGRDRSRISLGALQHYFSSKDDMLVFTLEFIGQEAERRVRDRIANLAGPPSPEAVVRETLAEMLRRAASAGRLTPGSGPDTEAMMLTCLAEGVTNYVLLVTLTAAKGRHLVEARLAGLFGEAREGPDEPATAGCDEQRGDVAQSGVNRAPGPGGAVDQRC